MFRFFTIFFLSAFSIVKMFSQCNVVVSSSNGYNVNIGVTLVSVIPSSTSCPNGYNYNVALTYTITFTGSNIPGSLYTLQGNFTCNSQSLFYDLPNNGGTGSYTTSSNPYISSNGTNIYTTHPSCTAANPTNLNCTGVTVDINGPGINNQTVNCAMSGPLPIGLSYFSGENTSKGLLFKWQTETERNNDFFTLEKSADGLEWIRVTQIDGAGNSSTRLNYEFTDDHIENGINYYHLKQTDFDGTYMYSSVIQVLNTTGNIICSNLWPNPATDKVNFEVITPVKGKATYTIFGDAGSPIKTGDFEFFIGKNELNISTENLFTGFYLLEITLDANTKVYRKIAKL